MFYIIDMLDRENSISNLKAGLERFMGRRRFSMNALAKATGMSTTNIYLMCHGKTLPALDKVAALVDEGMTAEELFGKEVADKLKRNALAAGEEPVKSVESSESPYDILEGGLAAILEKLRDSRNA